MTNNAIKTQVDIIICGEQVVTMDESHTVIENGAVAISGKRIVSVDTRDNIFSQFDATEVIDKPDTIVMPGLINTHTHVAMTLFRGVADDLELGSFLERVWAAESQYITQDNVRLGAQLGFSEMLLAGVTCCADMYWYPDITANAAIDMGMRIVSGEVFIDFPGPDGVTDWSVRLERAEQFIHKYSDNDWVTPVLCPHAVYTVSQEHQTEIKVLANQYDVGVHIHASEAPFEMQSVKEASGKTPVEVLRDTGLLGPKTWLAHAVHVDENDQKIIKSTQTSVAHCPVSNMKMASGSAPVVRYLEDDISVGLGTDGPSTSNDLNPWMVMRVAGLLQKNTTEDATALAARDIVEMATKGGANVLSLGDKIGQLSKGMMADITVLSCNKPHAMPRYDVYSHLVYTARPDDVTTVIVNGQLVVKNGELTKIDMQKIIHDVSVFKQTMQLNESKNSQGEV